VRWYEEIEEKEKSERSQEPVIRSKRRGGKITPVDGKRPLRGESVGGR